MSSNIFLNEVYRVNTNFPFNDSGLLMSCRRINGCCLFGERNLNKLNVIAPIDMRCLFEMRYLCEGRFL